jgi:hypothetical protein
MTSTNRTLTVGRTLLLAIILALGIATGIQPAGAACSDTAERYPMLLGSGYEGQPCQLVETSCQAELARYPMLIGSGYEGKACGLAASTAALDPVARSTNPKWHETMLDGSGYEREAIDTTLSGRDRD